MKDDSTLPIPEALDGEQWDVRGAPGVRVDTTEHMMLSVDDPQMCLLCGFDHSERARETSLMLARSRGMRNIPKLAASVGAGLDIAEVAEATDVEVSRLRVYATSGEDRTLKSYSTCPKVAATKVISQLRTPKPKMRACLLAAAKAALEGSEGDWWNHDTTPGGLWARGPKDDSFHEERVNLCVGMTQAIHEFTHKRRRHDLTDDELRKLMLWLDTYAEAADAAERAHREAERMEMDAQEMSEAQRKLMTKAAGKLRKQAQRDAEQTRAVGSNIGESIITFGDGRRRSISVSRPGVPELGLPWPTMHMDEVPMPLVSKVKPNARRFKAAADGYRLRYLNRMLADGHVFARKRRKEGGTVLIDTSGSMSWTKDQLLEIVDEVPAATIALYGGDGGDSNRLRIVAKNRRRCEDDYIVPVGGGNEVDGPALDWLAKQKEPRIWVSDGYACADNLDTDEAMYDCQRKLLKHNMRRVSHLEEALDAMRNPAIGTKTVPFEDN